MASQQLQYRQLISLAVAESATTPNPGVTGVWIWSTTVNRPMYWNGTQWTSVPVGAGGGINPGAIEAKIIGLNMGAYL
jgi:hypothetical protein